MRGLAEKVFVVAAGGTAVNDSAGRRASIGGATARRLAREGARVVVGDLDEEAANETVRLVELEGGKAISQQYDARDDASVHSLVERAVEEFGALDGVHVNAMDMSAHALGVDSEHDLLTLPLDVWQRTIDVGLTGFLLTARHTIPHLLESGGGSIVVTASVTVYKGESIRVAYATVKTGMTAIVRHIAGRWGRDGIRANAVAPGFVPSPAVVAAMSPDDEDRVLRRARSHRIGAADDIAATVSFLLSDDGAWVNGQVISVDGGVTMRA